MHDRKTAALAGVVTLLVGVGRVVPEVVSARLFRGPTDWLAALPQLGTLGQTASVYVGLLESVGPLVTWTLALGLGYYLASRRDVDDLRRLATDLATGSVTAVVVVAFAVGAAQALSGSLDGAGVLIVLVSLVSTVLSSAVPVVVGGVAAAALTAGARERESGASGEGATAGTGDAPPERLREQAVEEADRERYGEPN
jgi:hypothetical protein